MLQGVDGWQHGATQLRPWTALTQRGGAIVSAGGYPRALTAKARQGAFATGPLVVAGLKAKSQAGAPPRKTRRADP